MSPIEATEPFFRGPVHKLLMTGVAVPLQVCRAAGYYDHALYVAHAAHEPEWYLDILVDDCGKFDDALAYLQNLARQEAAAALKKHGKVGG